MSMHCKTCGVVIEESWLETKRGLVRCRNCDTVTELARSQAGPSVQRPWERPPVALPRGFECEQRGERLTIRWRWFSMQGFLMVFVLAGWGLVFGLTYAKYQGGELSLSGTELAEQALIFLVFCLSAAWLGYLAATNFINSTIITTSVNALHIRHTPLPWPGGGRVDSIRQLFSKQRVHRHRKRGRSYSYELHALLAGGKRRKLVGGLDEAAQALWLERALEEQLGIQDRPVSGEIQRA